MQICPWTSGWPKNGWSSVKGELHLKVKSNLGAAIKDTPMSYEWTVASDRAAQVVNPKITATS